MGSGAEAHVVVQLPVFQIVPGLESPAGEIGNLVPVVAVPVQQLAGVLVHIRLGIVIGDGGGIVVHLVHGGALLQLQAVAGDVLRVPADDFSQGIRPVRPGLPGQAVDQVHTDVPEAGLPGRMICLDGLTVCVPPADGPEDLIIGRLHTHGNTVHPGFFQQLQVVQPHAVRVHLHGDLRILQQPFPGLQGVQNLHQVLRPVIAGRAPADIHRVNIIFPHSGEALPDMGQEGLLIFSHHLLTFGTGIEIAVPALAGAEGNVNINT